MNRHRSIILKFWKDILPLEMYTSSMIFLYPQYHSYILLYYLITTVLAFIYYIYQLYVLATGSSQNEAINTDSPNTLHSHNIPRILLLQIQNIVYIMMPYVTYYYCSNYLQLPYLQNLIKDLMTKSPSPPLPLPPRINTRGDGCISRSNRIRMNLLQQLFSSISSSYTNINYKKLNLYLMTHMNLFLLFFAIIIYCISTALTPLQIFVTVLLSTTYFYPFYWGYNFNIYIMEAYRRRARVLSSQLISLIDTTATSSSGEQQSEGESCVNDIEKIVLQTCGNELNEQLMSNKDERCNDNLQNLEIGIDSTCEESLPENNRKVTDSHLQDDNNIATISLLRQKYLSYAKDCSTFSQQSGKYLLFLFGSALIFVIAAVWGIYLDHHNAVSTFPFVVVSLILVTQLGLSIAGANEAGHLVCRHISTYLLDTNQSNSEHEFHQRTEALLLLECMQFTKLEIPFFGNFVLRASTLLTILGSIIGAIIPGLIIQSQNKN